MDKIRRRNGKWCLNDVVEKVIKTTKPIVFMNAIQDKEKDNMDNQYYVEEKKAVELISNRKSKECKAFIAEYNSGKVSEPVENKNYIQEEKKMLNVIDIKNGLLQLAGQKMTVIFDIDGDKKDMWIKGIEIAKLLEYDDSKKAVQNNISNENKKKYSELFFKGDCQSPLKGNEKNTIFINISGLFELLLKSKKEEAKQFYKWVTNEVLPSLYKYGSYSIQDNKTQYKSLYTDKMITDYEKKNVVYIAYVGNYNNEEIFKYGISGDIFNREYKQHRKLFDKFEMILIEETDNNATIETMFGKNLKILNLHRQLTVNNKNQTELFTTTQQYPIGKILKMINELIKNNELKAITDAKNNSILKEKEYELEIKKEETRQKEIEHTTRQKEIELELKKEEIRLKEIELELKKIELGIQEEKDIYYLFKKEKIIIALNNNISSKDLYNHFTLWFKQKYPTDKIPTKSEFIKDIKRVNIEWCECCRVDGKVTTGFKNIKVV
jgi:prophage antirepressor-like protein